MSAGRFEPPTFEQKAMQSISSYRGLDVNASQENVYLAISIQFNSMIHLRLSHYKWLDAHAAIHTYTRMNNKILFKKL
jgi:hypothetical protein